MNLIQQLGGRKFVATVGCGVATTALTWFAKIDAGTYALVTIATVGAFIGGNVMQKRTPDDPSPGH